MRTLLEDGILKAAQGLLTLEDVVRVVSSDDSAIHKEKATAPDEVGAPSVRTYPGNTSKDTNAVDHFPGALSNHERGSLSAPVVTHDATSSHSGGKDLVLVVEDSATIASVVKYFLELEGFRVLVAADGNLGLAAAKDNQPQVIVTDFNMPGMDGVGMVKALRSNPRTAGIAVLMLTSEEGIEKETQALEAGVDDYIMKPVEPRRLAARVKSVLARSKTRRAEVLP